MSEQVRVYNRGIRAIVYERSYGGRSKVIHPKKSVELPEEQAQSVIDRFDDAVRSGVTEKEPVQREHKSKEKEALPIIRGKGKD